MIGTPPATDQNTTMTTIIETAPSDTVKPPRNKTMIDKTITDVLEAVLNENDEVDVQGAIYALEDGDYLDTLTRHGFEYPKDQQVIEEAWSYLHNIDEAFSLKRLVEALKAS